MDTTALAHKTEFEVTNIELLHPLLEIQITFNHDLIDLSEEAIVNKILKWFQMNESQSTLLLIDPHTGLKKQD
jgi:hypothetical protein